jgi:hypothetical protein
MTRKILITAVLGVAVLMLGASSALAKYAPHSGAAASVVSPEHADFWNYESGAKVADSSPGVPPEDLATLYGGSTAPVPVSVTASDSGIEWPQVGIGLGVGILLVLGIGLNVRVARARPIVY